MLEDVTFRDWRNLIPRTIQTFPEHFRGTAKANFMKASRWWNDQDNILNLADNANPGPLHVTRVQVGKWCKTCLKVCLERGHKRTPWVVWLYTKMVEEFDHLCKIGMSFLFSFLVLFFQLQHIVDAKMDRCMLFLFGCKCDQMGLSTL